MESGVTGVDRLSTVEKLDNMDNLALLFDCTGEGVVPRGEREGGVANLTDSRMTRLSLRFGGGRAGNKVGEEFCAAFTPTGL